MPFSEEDLSAILRVGAKLIFDCIQGRISFETCLVEYDSIYMYYAFDGHESDDAELELFQMHAAEIEVHEAVWIEIITKIIDDKFMNRPEVIRAGFIGREEGFTKIKEIAENHSQIIIDSSIYEESKGRR
jgi:hypothetical protein